jgi:asparagine synthase (glutamine-hydrolysing)
MRLIACFEPKGGAERSLREALGQGRQPGPPEQRSVFAFHLGEPRPDLGWATHSDGSTAIVDGEVFALPDGSAPASATAAAAAILNLYRLQGDKFLSQLNSAAAITVWDAAARRLLIARDRGGTGLCYVMERNGALFWASDMPTLVASDPRSALDLFAVDSLLAGGFAPAPWTSLAHIRKIPAAHKLVTDGGSPELQRYWWPKTGPKQSWNARRQADLDKLLENSVRRRLPDGERSAMLLSGGVDSMLMLAYLTRRCGATIEAFTYRYDEYDGVFNEGARARRAAEYCGVRHREILVRPRDLAETLDRILVDHNGPMSYAVHTSQMREIAASGFKLLFGGHAADSFFYSRVEEIGLRLRRWPKPVPALVGLVGTAMRGWNADAARRLDYAARVAQTGLTWRFHSPLTSESRRSRLYADPNHMRGGRESAMALYAPAVERFESWSECDHVPMVMQRFYTPENALHWMQSFARANGMIARCPYTDVDLVNYFYSLRRAGGKKDELRAVAATMLPQELATAPKLGQTLPLAQWFRGPLAQFVRERLAPDQIDAVGFFEPKAVQELVDRHFAGENHAWTIWLLINIVSWNRIVRDLAGTRRIRSVAAE